MQMSFQSSIIIIKKLTFYTINLQFLLTESFLVADQFICAVQLRGGSRLGLGRQVLGTGRPVRQRGLDPVIGRGFSERRTLVPHGLSLNILTFWADRDPRPLVSGCCVQWKYLGAVLVSFPLSWCKKSWTRGGKKFEMTLSQTRSLNQAWSICDRVPDWCQGLFFIFCLKIQQHQQQKGNARPNDQLGGLLWMVAGPALGISPIRGTQNQIWVP